MSGPSDRRAREQAAHVQSTIEARKAGVAVLGDQFGAPVDFSRGIDMSPPKAGTSTPGRVPNVAIPRPPELTQRDEEEKAKQEAEAERVQYEKSFVDAGLPPPTRSNVNPADFQTSPAAQQRDTPQRRQTRAANQHKREPHPLITQLRGEFGIGDKKPPVDVRVADHVWTFVPLTPEMISMTARMADMLAHSKSEHDLRAQHAAICCSIVAIDGVPIWQAFQLDPDARDDVSFPLIPLGPIRQRAALALYEELSGSWKNRVMEALYEAYLARVDGEGTVKGYTEYEDVEHVVWVCTDDACDIRLMRPRQYDDAGNELAWFCSRHGTELIDVDVTKTRIAEDFNPLR